MPPPMQNLQSFQRILQLAVNQMGVNLRGGNVPVSQRPLNDKQVAGGFVKVRGKRVPQSMRGQLLSDSGLLHPMCDAVGHLPLAESRHPVGKKQCVAGSCVLSLAFPQVALQQDAEVGLYEFDLYHISLGPHPQVLRIEVNVSDVQRGQFADADPGAQQDFDHDPVPHSGKARAAFYTINR